MDSNIMHFSNKLNQYFGENSIILSFISRNNIIIVTKGDKVYENAINNSLFIFSENESIIEEEINKSIVEELCNRGIIEFKNSNYHTIARTSDGKLYCWGSNEWGLLGNGINNFKLYKH